MDPFLEDRILSYRHGSQIHLVEDCKDGGTALRPNTLFQTLITNPSGERLQRWRSSSKDRVRLGLSKLLLTWEKRQSVYDAILFRGPC